MSAYEELGLQPELIRAVDAMGWLLPTPIQAEAIPLILGGGDVMGAAETGSGKTAAFGLPVIQAVAETLSRAVPDKPKSAQAVQSPPAKSGRAAVCMSCEDKDALFVVEGARCRGTSDAKFVGGRATVGLKGGSYCFEVAVLSDGLARLGWSTAASALELGTDKGGYGYGGTGKKSNSKDFKDYGAAFGAGDIIGCYISLSGSGGSIQYTKNGAALGCAYELPAVGSTFYFPAICLKKCGVDVNFGDRPWNFQPLDGFKGICSADAAHISQGSGPTATGGQAAHAGGCSTPIAIIIEPARDLAEQTAKCMQDYCRFLPAIKVECFIGSADSRRGREKVDCHIAVATPGRLLDLVQSHVLSLAKVEPRACHRAAPFPRQFGSQVRFFVLDEADRLLETGNLPTITELHRLLPRDGKGSERLQSLMFSATLHSPEIRQLSEQLCTFPTWIDLKGRDSVPETVTHLLVPIDPTRDAALWAAMRPLPPNDDVHSRDSPSPSSPAPESRSFGIKCLKLLKLIQLMDALKMSQCMIFCRTNVDCDNLEQFLIARGGGKKFSGRVEKGTENPYSCCVLAGMRSMEERRRNLQYFKDGDVRFLICTDVAARGLDIKNLPFVINLTLPDVAENYIHRIGRVGRADSIGLAISFVAVEKEKVWFHTCSSKGRDGSCSNTKLVDKGGCCIWYDEPQMLKDIERRLGQAIAHLPPDMKLTGGLENMVFGAHKDAASAPANSEHFRRLRPVMEELVHLETSAQHCFWNLKMRLGAQ